MCVCLVGHSPNQAHAETAFQKFRFNDEITRNVGDGQGEQSDAVTLAFADGNVMFSFGGSIRQRYEFTSNPLFGDDPQDKNGVWLQRANLHGDLRFGDHVRIFGEFSSALSAGRADGPSPVDENHLEFQNLFLDLSTSNGSTNGFRLRAGRQELEFGRGRLIDAREGTNVRRTFNAIRLTYSPSQGEIDVFAARPLRLREGAFDDRTDDDTSVWGIYASGFPLPHGNHRFDVYYLGFENEAASFANAAGHERRHTIGARLYGEKQSWDWDVEAMWQWGDIGAQDIEAWSITSEVGRTWDTARRSPHVALRVSVASGDQNPSDQTLETFNPMFPRGNYFSQAAVFGPRNLISVNPRLGLQLANNVELNADINFLWRQTTGDGVYSPSGKVIRAAGGSNERYVATTASLELAWAINRNTDFTAIYARLEPGSFIKDTGSSESVDFFEVTWRYRF